MNACLQDQINGQIAFDAQRIRGLQDHYPKEHHAFRNWGAWSSDRRGIFPKEKPGPLGGMFDRGGCDPEGWGEESERTNNVILLPQKAERAERIPYDEKSAVLLDERIHSAGGLNVEVRKVIRVAYVTREIPEDQFPRFAGCLIDAYCERLEAALLFARRFV